MITYSDPYMHLYPTRCADHACPVLFGLISYIVSSMHPRLRSNPHPSKNYENTKWNYNIYLHIYIYIFIQFGYILWINGTCSSRWITLGIADSYQWIESWLYMFLSKKRMIKINMHTPWSSKNRKSFYCNLSITFKTYLRHDNTLNYYTVK